MLKFLALLSAIAVCSARPYGGSSYGGDSYGGHSIELPIHSSHRTEVIHSQSSGQGHSTHVDVPSGVWPVYMTFRTQSSPVHVRQEHRGSKGSYQRSSSKDEPHHLVHEVTKPVIQELREVITPYRKVIQVIEPVREEVVTKVHKNEGRSSYGDDGGYGGGYGGEERSSYGSYKSDDTDGYSGGY